MPISLGDFKPRGQGLPCSIATLLATAPPDDLKIIEAALANPSIQHAAIERVLEENGYRVGTGSVGKHRRGTCRCGR